MITVFTDYDAPNTDGTSLKGYVNATYEELVGLLGFPTFNEPSGDEKVQVEWVVEFEDEIFTIYDWKTNSRYYTENMLERFHIGGKSYSGELESFINQELGN